MPAAVVRRGRAVTLPVPQTLAIARKKVPSSAVGEAVANPSAFTKILAVTKTFALAKSPANARDNAIAQGIADSEIFPDSKALSDPQTYSGAEA